MSFSSSSHQATAQVDSNRQVPSTIRPQVRYRKSRFGDLLVALKKNNPQLLQQMNDQALAESAANEESRAKRTSIQRDWESYVEQLYELLVTTRIASISFAV
ncbi:hypothetical protein FRC03_000075 [Tulasnella sp. 419]|nr:hypothetical protein FRC03_000075 [Tulasnella sp. 419]